MAQVLICNDDLDNYLSAIYYAYYSKAEIAVIVTSDVFQQMIGCENVYIKTNSKHADKVRNAIIRDGGTCVLHDVGIALKSNDTFKGVIIFKFLQLLFKYKRQTVNMYNEADIVAFHNIVKRVKLEIHRMKGFVTFSATTSGIYYASIVPDNNIIEYIMPHFANRFGDMDFIIQDESRAIAGMSCNGEYVVKQLDTSIYMELSKEEMEARRLFSTYVNSVNIKERTNRKLQDNYMPRRYQKNYFNNAQWE